MSLVSEIVVEQGNPNFDVDGWRVCSFVDTDLETCEDFTNYEVAYWRGGSVEWGSVNGCLEYFSCLDRALDFFSEASGVLV